METDQLKFMIEATMPNNTILYDDKGKPSVMVRIPKFRICDVIEGGSGQVHPAFIAGGKVLDEIFISKYSNILEDGRAYSLPGRDPAAELSIGDARDACENKGKGWHLMSNAEWAAIALWCKKNGFMPGGNNACGNDFYHPHERGRVTYTYERQGEIREGRTATGSGPVSWAHDNSPSGICDMNGNVWAQVSGFRVVNGELQIIPDNDSALAVDETAQSKNWKAILPDGSLVSPGTEGTLKLHSRQDKLALSTENAITDDKWNGGLFCEMEADFKVPGILKALALYPADVSGYGQQKFWCNNSGERIPWRGGTWDAYANSGIFCLFTCYPRTHNSIWCGFRSAYIEIKE